MKILKFVEFAHNQSEEINKTLREFTYHILEEEKSLVDMGFWDNNGKYNQNLVWINKESV